MKNPNNLNSWTNFALNHVYKDMNNDALKTIDALMFLSPPDENTFKEVFSFNLDIGVDVEDVHRSARKVQKETVYNFADFLVLKLIENFRRIYAVEKDSEKYKADVYYRKRGFDLDRSELLDHEINPTKFGSFNDSKKSNLNSLEQQQDNIYSIIERLNGLLFFKKDVTLYPKAIVGKNYEATIFEISCYLGLHQSLKNLNVIRHKNFMTKMNNSFTLEDIHRKNLKLFNKLYYPYERRCFIQMYLNKFPMTSLVEEHLSFNIDRPGNFYQIALIDLLGKNQKITLNREQKIELLIGLFRNPFFKYFSNEDRNDFEKTLDTLFSDVDYEVLFKRNILSPAKQKSSEYQFAIKRITSSSDEELFLKSFYENLTPEVKDELLNLFDLSDQSFLKRVVDKLSEKSNAVQKLEQVLPYFELLTTDSLAYIISKNANFFSVIQPYYLMEKLTPALKDKPMSTLGNNPIKI